MTSSQDLYFSFFYKVKRGINEMDSNLEQCPMANILPSIES